MKLVPPRPPQALLAWCLGAGATNCTFKWHRTLCIAGCGPLLAECIAMDE